mmetsp:Transcript_1567/g.2509  ORF Transcript_1567/g.2509 Transcript_1567/m.2509 type:complete len:151 (+) Transcript_1567:62-514(+)
MFKRVIVYIWALLLLSLHGIYGNDSIDFNAMRVKELKRFLYDRGLNCIGCAEKADYVKMAEEHRDTPKKQSDTRATSDDDTSRGKSKDDSMADILEKLKQFGGAKVFTQDDLKNMNFDEMKSSDKSRRSKRDKSFTKKNDEVDDGDTIEL